MALCSDLILWGVRSFCLYPISYRQLEEMMCDRGVEVDHGTLSQWFQKYAPELEQRGAVRRNLPTIRGSGEWTRPTSRSKGGQVSVSGSGFTGNTLDFYQQPNETPRSSETELSRTIDLC